MLELKTNWLAIVNPVSGSGKGAKKWKKIEPELRKAGIDFERVFSEYEWHCETLCIDALKEGYRKLILVGGDGTFHEITNALCKQSICDSQEVLLAMLPTGTGNDWARTMGINSKYKKSIQNILDDRTLTQDAGLITYTDENGQSAQRYFLNVAGLGYDAYVAKNYLQGKEQLGQLTYLTAGIRGLYAFQNQHLKLSFDGKDIDGKIVMTAVGLCRYFGAGMKIAPDAIPDDGLFDLSLVGDISKWGVLKEIKNLYDGSFVKNPKVEIHRTAKIEVDSKDEVYIQADGELLGTAPATFEIIQQKIKVIVPKLLNFS